MRRPVTSYVSNFCTSAARMCQMACSQPYIMSLSLSAAAKRLWNEHISSSHDVIVSIYTM